MNNDFKDMKESTTLESCNDEHHNETSLKLTPDVIVNERQVQVEQESCLDMKQKQHNSDKDLHKKRKEKLLKLRQQRADDAAMRIQQNIKNNNNESRTTANTATTSSTEVGAIVVNGINFEDSNKDDDSITNDDYQSNSLEMYSSSSSSSSSHLQSSCDSDAQLPMASPVDIDALQAQYKIPSRGSVLQKMKAELTVADEVVQPNNTIRPNSKFRILVSTVVFIIIAIVIGVVVMSKTKRQRMDNVTFAPTTSPTLSNFNNLQEQMKSISGDTVFDDSSPQYKALSWLTYEDPFLIYMLSQDDYDDELLDRYILAVVYFSTGGPNWSNDLNFLTNSSVCDWNNHHNKNNEGEIVFGRNKLSNGVHCDNRGATKILLDRNNLNGTIPFEIGTTLKYVDEISFSNNFLYGTIPSSFGNLHRLEFLDVSTNLLYGTIPTSLTHLTRLKYFSTKYNHLTGPIPSAITNLVSLERLDLSFNQLTGSIPEFSLQNSFEYLSIYNNLIDGPLPESLVQLSNLEVLNLSNNFLTGTIPLRLGMLKNLSILYLFGNEINGSVPISISNLDVLTVLAVHSNSLTGRIPSAIGKLTKLKQVFLYDNNLSGTVPTELGQCTNLNTLNLAHNPELNGTIPPTFSNMHQIEILRLHDTSITGSIDRLVCALQPVASADCGGISPNVNCTCCVECCDPLLGICKHEKDKKCDIIEYHMALFGHTAECTCGSSARSTWICSFEDCQTCNEDNTICGALKESGYKQPLHFSITHHNIFQYNVGRNETIMWDETPEVDCNVSINDQQCNECSVYYCRDGFPARYIDCTNIVDVVDGGIYDTCQHYETGGVFEWISWWDKFSWAGCTPFFYRPRQ